MMKTSDYKWGQRWKRAVAAGQTLLADQIAFEERIAALYRR